MIPIRSYWNLLSAYLRNQRARTAVLAVLLFTGIGLQVLNPQIIRSFIDRATTGDDTGNLVPLAVAFMVIAVIYQLLNVAATWMAENIGWKATNDLRRDLADHLLYLDMDFHKTHTPGELVERVDGDVTALSNFFGQFMIHVVGNLVLLAGILGLLFRESIWVGSAMTAFALAGLGVMVWIQRLATDWWAQVKAVRAEMFGFLGEQVGGTEDVRANGAARYMMRRFTRLLRRWLPAEVKGRHGWSVLWSTNIVVFAVGSVLVFTLGSWLFNAGTITIGSVYLIFHYTEMLRHPLDRIRNQMEDFQKAAAGIHRVQALLDRETRLPRTGTETLPSGPLSVDLQRIDFSYREDEDPNGSRDGNGGGSAGERVLHGVTLNLAPGRILGLLGRTGSGKTTLARLLTRLYDPDTGTVVLGGVDTRVADVHSLRRRVGMVTQDVQLFAASIRDNLTFFDPGIGDDQIERALETLGLIAWVDRMPAGLDTVLEAGGGGLSAGEAQLLAFTRIFLEDSGLVVLDEASSRLDPATEQLIETAVDRLLADRTGVIIAHRLDTVNRADDIMILEDGRVVENGPRTELAGDAGSRFSRLLATGIEEVLR
ncbi:MAG: ABC transporter ATP-binding protein [Acidimicrobiia bacterium]|nr:ABC transporter ATP-binding protein [Acidimicrobiia bacterium]